MAATWGLPALLLRGSMLRRQAAQHLILRLRQLHMVQGLFHLRICHNCALQYQAYKGGRLAGHICGFMVHRWTASRQTYSASTRASGTWILRRTGGRPASGRVPAAPLRPPPAPLSGDARSSDRTESGDMCQRSRQHYKRKATLELPALHSIALPRITVCTESQCYSMGSKGCASISVSGALSALSDWRYSGAWFHCSSRVSHPVIYIIDPDNDG